MIKEWETEEPQALRASVLPFINIQGGLFDPQARLEIRPGSVYELQAKTGRTVPS